MFRKSIIFALCIALVVLSIGVTGCEKQKTDIEGEDTNVSGVVKQDDSIKQNDNRYKLNLKDEPIRNNVKVEGVKTDVDAKVKPYKVDEDLSNIVNLDKFGDFTDEQKKLLSKNGFVVTPRNLEQMFYLYEYNEYSQIPSFVTTDSVLQAYRIFYSYSLRKIEKDILMEDLKKLTTSMLDKSIYLYDKTKSVDIKNALSKNIAYFEVAKELLGDSCNSDIPEQAKNIVDSEMKLIIEKKGFERSPLFSYKIDYSQFLPRGHYTRNSKSKQYFKTMMWFGNAPFSFYARENGEVIETKEDILSALLMTYSLFLESNDDSEISDSKCWENIYDITNFYVGSCDDLSIYDFKELITKIYGENPKLEDFADRNKLQEVYKAEPTLPEPKILSELMGDNFPVGKQFKFMGQRYTPDADILSSMISVPNRVVPSGIDVMGVLGSQRAFDIQVNENKVTQKWEGYTDAFKRTKSKFDALGEDVWKSNMYYGWMWTLRGMLDKFGEGYPSFMTNKAWEDKSISSSLGSWAQLKHDTVLYAKGICAECGGWEIPKISGYVEPNVKVYSRLLWLTKYSKENLKARGIDTLEAMEGMESLEDLLEFLLSCSIKELNGEDLSDEENYKLLSYGGWLERIMCSFIEGSPQWYEITSETDRNIACIADILTVGCGKYLEVGVGPAYEIYVVVPVGDKLQLTRGAVFSYDEFVSDDRLTDEKWQEMIKNEEVPIQEVLEWQNSFLSNQEKSKPYDSESAW